MAIGRGDGLELRYKLTRGEFQEMGWRERQRNPKLRKNSQFVSLYCAALVFFGVFYSAESLVLALILAAMAAAFTPFLMRASQRNAFGRYYDLIRTGEETHVRLDAAGLYLSRPHLRSEIDWEAVTTMTEDEIGFYLTYAPLQSLCVPRRVFASAAEAQRFWTMAQEYRQFARPAAADKTAVRI